MNRIIAVVALSIAAAFVPAACDDPTMPTSPASVQQQPVVDQQFVDFYLGAITGTRLAPGEYVPGTNPLTEMLGK